MLPTLRKALDMISVRHALCVTAALGALLVGGASYLCTHGVQANGWLSVAMISNSLPPDSSLVGRTIPIDGSTSVRVTAISNILQADGSVGGCKVHADVLGRSRQWFSLKDRAWHHVFLASSRKVHAALRAEASLPEQTTTHLISERLLP
jgi:hypothetical protein